MSVTATNLLTDPEADSSPARPRPTLPVVDGALPPEDGDETALPSVLARALAFGAVLVAGLCGGLIGYAFVDLQCTGDCTVPAGLIGLLGAVVAAVGVGVVSVLALRAMGEWRRMDQPDS